MMRRLTAAFLTVAGIACSDATNVGTATSGTNSPPVTSPSQPPAQNLLGYHVTGRVVDDAGNPIAGAHVYFTFTTSIDPRAFAGDTSTYSDSSGDYAVDFTALPGGASGPPGTSAAFAFAWAGASGHDWDNEYVIGPDPTTARNFRLRRIVTIAAGDSTSVVVDASSPICSNNAQDTHPWPEEWICNTVHVHASKSGQLTVYAISKGPSLPQGIEIEPGHAISFADPVVVSMFAGNDYAVNVEIPFGSAGRTFTLHTVLRP